MCCLFPSIKFNQIVFSAVLDMKPLEVSQPGSRLSDSPAPPCVQQDIKIKQEPKTPIAPKKTQVSVTREDGADSFARFVTHIVFNWVSFLPPGRKVKEHGLLGQPGSEVPVHTVLLCALLKWQLWTVQKGSQGERGEGETVKSTGRAGPEGARETSVRGEMGEQN